MLAGSGESCARFAGEFSSDRPFLRFVSLRGRTMHDRASSGTSPWRFLAPGVLTFACSLSSSLELRADERLEGIACRSVHLGYDAPEGDAFYTEIRVVSSAPGTYFCTNGFRMGYFGIQELANREKLVIFSVWDP